MKLSITIIIFATFIGCGPTKKGPTEFYNGNIPKVDFCELPKYKGQKVYLNCYYSGMEEYWSLNIGRKKCSTALTVNLDFDGGREIPKKFESVFEDVYRNYYNSYLIIEAVGVFENDEKGGYGHLGSNNSRFVVSKLIQASLVRK